MPNTECRMPIKDFSLFYLLIKLIGTIPKACNNSATWIAN